MSKRVWDKNEWNHFFLCEEKIVASKIKKSETGQKRRKHCCFPVKTAIVTESLREFFLSFISLSSSSYHHNVLSGCFRTSTAKLKYYFAYCFVCLFVDISNWSFKEAGPVDIYALSRHQGPILSNEFHI